MDRLSGGKKFWMGGFPYQIVSSNRLSGWQCTRAATGNYRTTPEHAPEVNLNHHRTAGIDNPTNHATTQNTLQKSTTTGRLESTTQRIMQLIRHSYKERRNRAYIRCRANARVRYEASHGARRARYARDGHAPHGNHLCACTLVEDARAASFRILLVADGWQLDTV